MKANTIGKEEQATETDLRHDSATLRERVLILEDEKRELQAFAALAAHELLEPLVMADAYAQIVINRLSSGDAESIENLMAMSRGLARARLLVGSLLQGSAPPPRWLGKQPVDLDAVLRDTLELLQPEIVARKVKVDAQRLPTVKGDATLLSALMKNLLVNALKYGPRSGGMIAVFASRRSDEWVV